MSDLTVKIARRDNGKFAAVSTASPFFCFEGPSEEEVKQKVDLALAFYSDAKKTIRAKTKETETQITVSRVKSF